MVAIPELERQISLLEKELQEKGDNLPSKSEAPQPLGYLDAMGQLCFRKESPEETKKRAEYATLVLGSRSYSLARLKFELFVEKSGYVSQQTRERHFTV